ncbi:MAG: glycyl-tRNA synthetase beta chain [Gammaproteobacteria bacterium]|jgi:glycyl-tRNA synthetase beta chain
MTTHNFLFELGTEELPPKSLKQLSDIFEKELLKGLVDSSLAFGRAKSYASPRRLAIVIHDLQAKQPDKEVEKRGPAVKAAYDKEGNPSKALQGFARSCGVEVDQLISLKTNKGEWLGHRSVQAGQSAAEVLPKLIERALSRLPIAKRMRWGTSTAEFVRPVKWIASLLDDQIMPLALFGLSAGNLTRGHRFHCSSKLLISNPNEYADILLQQGSVVADYDQRKQQVREMVENAATELGGSARIDPNLLDEVSSLVEWPSPIVGQFDKKFLDMPSEMVISTIEDHQKYFPVFSADGKLMNSFITIANIVSKDPAAVSVGNEKVVSPRLEDTLFFWNQDRKQTLAERRDRLKSVMFQKELGSVYAKTERVTELAASLAGALNVSVEKIRQAGAICRSDLVTYVVYEMPELQGLMGRYYAELEGLDSDICESMEEQYFPRFSGDGLPNSGVSTSLALAEKLDSICGIFAIGRKPTGDKDPFALRRAAIGVLRILIEKKIPLSLGDLLHKSVSLQPVTTKEPEQLSVDLRKFFEDRLKAYCLDNSYSADQFEAVMAANPSSPLDVVNRLAAVSRFLESDDAIALAAANKRIGNILKKNAAALGDSDLNKNLLTDKAEKEVAAALDRVRAPFLDSLGTGDYLQALGSLAGLRQPVDDFFENVMVMADDMDVRANRLALLSELRGLFMSVADFSLVQQ